MDTQIETMTTAITAMSSSDQLKTIICSLTEQSTAIKVLMGTVRSVLKDVDRQSKDFDKLRNKRSRVKSERKASDVPSGITKPVPISDALALFLGVEPGTLVPRNEVTKGVSSYVRKFELSDPSNKQKFVLTGKPEGLVLKTLLGDPAEEVTYFNLQRYLKHHYTASAPSSASAPRSAVTATIAPKALKVIVPTIALTESPVESGEKVLKKKMVLKKKKEPSSELTED